VIGAQAKETLGRQQESYRKAYDTHLRLRNSKVKESDFWFVRVYTDSPMLTLPLSGPFQVKRVNKRNGTFAVRTREGLVRVANNRVHPAPVPRDLPEGIILAPQIVPKTPEEGTEYVVERLMSYGRSTNDEVLIRVRWAGYSEADDTWEKADDVLLKLVKAYAKRKKVSLSELGL
jgi:Chromo (CHRromatin Organisation MOdifier) domain